ncbi:complex I NDUFA9 subunit family protein [Niveibacterium sp. SC-1]|uniref:complex I NDUFA9 subunit family protein n=1 Tax=Niveibacterium sp. SC-1 TaxID=3135646 RepID=UPI00311DAE8D
MTPQRILLIGGSGFIGSHLANLLDDAGCRVRVPARRREEARHLLLLPQTEVVEADVHDPAQLAALMQNVDAVVNLVGVLHSPGGSPYGKEFARNHVALPRAIAEACAANGVRRLVHVSALGVGEGAPSQYLRSKTDGEAALREAATAGGLEWTIFRPSVVFGPGDRFLSVFACLARFFWVLPVGGANARFQPVYVGDVAQAIKRALLDRQGIGQTLELAGPDVLSLKALVELAARESGHPRPVLALPGALASLQATVLSWLPGSLMSPDNLRSMERDNVASGTPLPFGLVPTPLGAVTPRYLGGKEPRARYYSLRRQAGRQDVR